MLGATLGCGSDDAWCTEYDLGCEDPPIPFSAVELHSHPSDAIFAELVSDQGDVVVIAGSKNAEGIPSELQLVDIYRAGESSPTSIWYGPDGRPSLVIAPTGEQLEVTYLSDTEVQVTATNADGTEQERVSYSLEEPLPANAGPAGPTSAGSPAPLAASTTSRLIVNVLSCGIDAVTDACVTLRGTIGDRRFYGPVHCSSPGHVDPGQYEFIMPSLPGTANVAELCKWVVWAARKAVLGKFVTVPACTLLTAGWGVVACAGTASAAESYLEHEGTHSVANWSYGFCDDYATVDYDGSIAPSEVVSLEVMAKYGKDTLYDRFEGPLTSGVWPELTLDFGGIDGRITTTPFDPAPEQDYTAHAEVTCLPGNNEVTLSISGTDGYSNAVTETLSGNTNIELVVPGGGQSVKDTLSLVVDGNDVLETQIVF